MEIGTVGGTRTVSDFSGESVGLKIQKQGGVDLTDICKIRFLMACTQRFYDGVRSAVRTPAHTHTYTG